MGWKAYEVEPLVWVDSIYTLFWQKFSKGYNFRGETHNFWECVYILKGSVSVIAEERVMALSEGDIAFHKPLELHKFSIESDIAELLIFSFSMHGELTFSMRDKVVHVSDAQRATLAAMLAIADGVRGERAEKETWIAYHPFFAERADFLQRISLYITELVMALADTENRYTVNASYGARQFTKAVAFFGANVDKNISVAEIARHINTSESGVKRIFKTYANMGVHEYFLMMKLAGATELLKNGCSVSEASERLGFSSQSYFSACYKRSTGKNPSEIK